MNIVQFEKKISLILNAQGGDLPPPHDDYSQSGNLPPGGAIGSI